MKNATTLSLVSLFAVTGMACSSGGGGGTVACTNSGNALSAADANNYAFSSTLTFPVTKIKPMSEITFDWSGVTTDFLGHAVDPKQDIDMIVLIMWKLPIADLQTKLNADILAQKDLVVVPMQLNTDGSSTSGKLFSFKLSSGQELDQATILSYFDAGVYTPNDQFTYTVMAASGNTVGQGVRMIQAFQLDPNSTNTDVTLTTSSTHLQWSANLHSLTPTGLPAGKADIAIDWSKVTKTALGQTFDPTKITNILVGHYTESPTELESKFLDIQLIATDLYTTVVNSGTTATLSTLVTAGGKAFSGIDSNGTWLVALQCGDCRNPAPWYLSILKTCQ